MAEEENETGPAEAAPAKSKKKLFIGIGAAVLVVALAAGAFFYLWKAPSEGAEVLEGDLPADGLVPEGEGEEDELEEGEEAYGGIFPLETFVVNLEGGKFLRCQVQVEFTERDIPKRFYVKLVPIRDALITLFSSRTADDVSSARGRGTLKSEIKDVINELMRREDVRRVYFTQFLVQ